MNFQQHKQEIFESIKVTARCRTRSKSKSTVDLNTPTSLGFSGNVLEVPIAECEQARTYLAWASLVAEYLTHCKEVSTQHKELGILLLEYAPILLRAEACEPLILALVGDALTRQKPENIPCTSNGTSITPAYVFARTRFVIQSHQPTTNTPTVWHSMETFSITEGALQAALVRDGQLSLIDSGKEMSEVPDNEMMRLVLEGLRSPGGPIEKIRELVGYPEPPRNEEGILVLADEEMASIHGHLGNLVWSIMAMCKSRSSSRIDVAPIIARGVVPVVPDSIVHTLERIASRLEN